MTNTNFLFAQNYVANKDAKTGLVDRFQNGHGGIFQYHNESVKSALTFLAK